MSDERERLRLSKAHAPGPRKGGSPGLPPVLARQAVRRVRILALIVLGMVFLGWVVGNVVEGAFLQEFDRAGEWAPPVLMLVASSLILAASRWRGLAADTLVNVALVYEVAVSLAIALSAYYDTFGGIPAQRIETDVVGLTGVAVWMLGFTVLVPSRPRRALVALVLSALTVPAVYLLEVRAGRAPALGTMQLWLVFTVPYLEVAVVSYIAARVIYRLGQDVTLAREMGSYRLVERLGEGGMGEVWRAHHHTLARPAAIKLIRRESLGSGPSAADLVARFEREAQATALLQSPHTVEVYDFGTTDDGAFYYVMELLEGIDLEELVRRFGPQPPGRVVGILRQVCASLAEAHARDLVHRDIKPANIYLCRRGLEDDFVKVLDFGLVKQRSTPGELHLTQDGAIQGTPAYVAPEMARGDANVDGRADLYALGCVAFWLLTGRLVFERDSFAAMLVAHATQTPAPPSSAAPQPVPPALDELVLACLAKEPEERVPSAGELDTRLATLAVPDAWTPAQARAWWRANMAPG